MKKGKKRWLVSLFLIFCVSILMVCTVSAAPKYRNEWRKSKGQMYYYNDTGKKATGFVKIGSKRYYFDKSGIQRTGWEKIGSSYYFFRITPGKKGYMQVSQTIDGIKLSKSGKASYNSAEKRKLDLMVKANSIMQSITNCDMSSTEKLRKCFRQAKSYRFSNTNFNSTDGYWVDFKSSGDWDVRYAESMLYYGRGDCFASAAAFAYLANAVGYRYVNVVSSGGHGWAEVSNKVYDPNWSWVTGKEDAYFAVPYSLSGIGGRPNYKNARSYIKKVQ